MNLSSELKIETPEGISFSYALAGPITRCLAWVIDLVVLTMLLSGVGKGFAMLRVLNGDFSQALTVITYFIVLIGYGVVLEWFWRGQTVGKRFLRLRVMDVHGFHLRFYQVLLRNLLRAIDSLPLCYLVGGLCCLLSQRAQRLGDLAAGTVVVHHVHPFEPDLEQLLAGKYNSLRGLPHLVARLRQRVAPAEATLALQALLRREEFEAGARVDLFRRLADHFRALVTFPPEAVEVLSDEQYVRNVVDLLFRTRGGGASEPRKERAPGDLIAA